MLAVSGAELYNVLMGEDFDKVVDEIGPWTQVKLEIIRKYASAYSRIVKGFKFKTTYIDAFAGLGYHKSKETQELVDGSPHIALHIEPPFDEYHFIDIDKLKVKSLANLRDTHPAKVFVYEGDCNAILLKEVLPKLTYESYQKGLCLLDPYGLHLQWDVIRCAGQLKSTEIFLNFPIMDMNMNILKHSRKDVDPKQAQRLSLFWGDDSWEKVAYGTTHNLFGWEEKESNEVVVRAFCKRLQQEAGFKYVADPLPMKNRTNSTVYYLLFASPNDKGKKIVGDIFNRYR